MLAGGSLLKLVETADPAWKWMASVGQSGVSGEGSAGKGPVSRAVGVPIDQRSLLGESPARCDTVADVVRVRLRSLVVSGKKTKGWNSISSLLPSWESGTGAETRPEESGSFDSPTMRPWSFCGPPPVMLEEKRLLGKGASLRNGSPNRPEAKTWRICRD